MTFFGLMARDVERFTDADFAPLLDAEAEAVRVLYAAGSIRAAYGRHDTPGAVLIIEADDEAHAQRVIGQLPLYAKGMLTAQLIPAGPYRGFGPRG